MFIHFNNKIVDIDRISYVEFKNYVEEGYIKIHYKESGSLFDYIEGADATRLIMMLCPSALEGTRLKYKKHSWAIHNLVSHPLMQILSWMKLTKLGIWVHDISAPKPVKME